MLCCVCNLSEVGVERWCRSPQAALRFLGKLVLCQNDDQDQHVADKGWMWLWTCRNGDEDKKNKNSKGLWSTVYWTLAATTSMQMWPDSPLLPMRLVPVAFEGFLGSSVRHILGTCWHFHMRSESTRKSTKEGCFGPMGNDKFFSLPERQIPYNVACMWNLKYATNVPRVWNRNRLTGIEKSLVVPKGKGEWRGWTGSLGLVNASYYL